MYLYSRPELNSGLLQENHIINHLFLRLHFLLSNNKKDHTCCNKEY